MKKLAVLFCGITLLVAMASPGLAFQEYPSLEIAPYVGYLAYDGNMTSYMSNLAYGMRLDLRTMAALGFQFHYSRTTTTADLPGVPFGADEYVERIQLNFTRDVMLTTGMFISGYAGVGSFNRHTPIEYNNDPSVQAGLAFRRNIVGPFYFRGDMGWTGAFLKDHDEGATYYERTLTHHLEAAITISVLLDN